MVYILVAFEKFTFFSSNWNWSFIFILFETNKYYLSSSTNVTFFAILQICPNIKVNKCKKLYRSFNKEEMLPVDEILFVCLTRFNVSINFALKNLWTKGRGKWVNLQTYWSCRSFKNLGHLPFKDKFGFRFI